MQDHTKQGQAGHAGQALGAVQERVILEGRYRIIRCLVQRPRLNLYLGQRLLIDKGSSSFLNDLPENAEQVQEPLVAIRELVLTGLPSHTRMLIEAAAFEEFISPSVFGSSYLPTTGDRVWIEGEKHYLVMQLTDAKITDYDFATPLDTLLEQAVWPQWLDTQAALAMAIQLCRLVARLHRQGIVLGILSPSTVLVDGQGNATWSPALLPCWPPAPSYWKTPSINVSKTYAQIFPTVEKPVASAFIAPELLEGIASERSDVYSLGALLYLLLTQFAPVAPIRRQYARYAASGTSSRGGNILVQEQVEGLELIPLRFLNENISPLLEQIVLRALELEPAKRYESAFAFVEALEGIAE